MSRSFNLNIVLYKHQIYFFFFDFYTCFNSNRLLYKYKIGADNIKLEILKQYKAKLDGQSIYEHNKDLINILNQLNLDSNTYNQMINIINYHDIGKVAGSFQSDISNTHRKVRHEMLSASVESISDLERLVILTHHKSLKDIVQRFDTYRTEYLQELKEMEEKLGIKMIDISLIAKKFIRNNKLLTNNDAFILKGLLNYCDHLGSSNTTKIDKGFDANEQFKFKAYSSVQSQVKEVNEDVIMVSSTGSGKTEASLFWASNVDKNKDKRIFYILPFTASINAMYKRFNDEAISVGMMHSKANYFLYKEHENTKLARDQYQSYKYFTKNITISTIYQLFKAVFNCKFNEMLLSMFQNSIFIIDEIHCYDEKQLAMILTTLKFLKDNYKVNICIMSASIPEKLLKLIQSELNISTIIKQSQEEVGKIKRHTIKYKEKFIEDDIDLIRRNIEQGKKVLICVNTVKQSQMLYGKISKYVDEDDISLLHSNFNTRDREKIESDLKNKKVLIGTQTIEVSLDIDYDVMFTEISPIDSQIQRWGRINRKRIEYIKERKVIYIYKTNSNIYEKDIISRTKEVLININDLDENNIQDYLNFVYDKDFDDYFKYKDIMNSIIKNCKVAEWDDISEYNSFTGASVLPVDLEIEYDDLMAKGKYYDAGSLLVNITEGKFYIANKNNAIINKGDGKYVVCYNYCSKTGLQFGEYDNFF